MGIDRVCSSDRTQSLFSNLDPKFIKRMFVKCAEFEFSGCLFQKPDSLSDYVIAWRHGLFGLEDSSLCSQRMQEHSPLCCIYPPKYYNFLYLKIFFKYLLLLSVLDLQMKAEKTGWQIVGNDPQKVAGYGEDLQGVGGIEHVIRKSFVRQLVVMEIHRPVNH